MCPRALGKLEAGPGGRTAAPGCTAAPAGSSARRALPLAFVLLSKAGFPLGLLHRG